MSEISEKLKLSRDEFRNISRCLNDEKFVKLFAEYCQELNDPDNQKQYEEEFKIMEAERGYDVTFLKPLPGYVIKTVADGNMKVFVNVCYSDLVEKPTSQYVFNEKGHKGVEWNIPYAQSHPRKDYDNKKVECFVYDVIFHYDTLQLTKSDAEFRKLVTEIALSAVESAFNVCLDKANLKFPKLQFKGIPKMTVIRKKSKYSGSYQTSPVNNILSCPEQSQKATNHKAIRDEKEQLSASTDDMSYVTPSYKLIHRKEIEYFEHTNELDAKVATALPKDLMLVIDLPLLKTTNDCCLNVSTNEIYFASEKPARYRLKLELPYKVLEKDGSAKFNTDDSTLTVLLPIIKDRYQLSDFHAMNDNKRITMETELKMDENKQEATFMPKSSEVISKYTGKKMVFPKFSANRMDDIFAFTLNVRNVDPTSIELHKGVDSISCEFTNMGSGFFPCFYKFHVRFPNIIITDVQYEEWDNNLILQVVLDQGSVNSYFAGVDEHNLTQFSIMEDITNKEEKNDKELEDDSLCVAVSKTTAKLERKSSNLSIEIKTKEEINSDDENVEQKTEQKLGNAGVMTYQNTYHGSLVAEQNKQETVNEGKKSRKNHRRKNKKRSLSESICDQLKAKPLSSEMNEKSHIKTDIDAKEPLINSGITPKQRKSRSISESCTIKSNDETESNSADNLTKLIQLTHKHKGILKRSSFQRSISECSSIDDYYYLGTSMDGCEEHCADGDSSIEHPNVALSECCRKTVRFSDCIKTKLFRSNTSILSQKRKNAKKNESKRRVLSRRLSEGESTDNEDKDAVKCNQSPVAGLQRNIEHDSGISLESDSGVPIEKTTELVMQQHQKDSSRPIEISQKGEKKNNNQKVHKPKQSQSKNVDQNDLKDVEFKNGMIFEIEI